MRAYCVLPPYSLPCGLPSWRLGLTSQFVRHLLLCVQASRCAFSSCDSHCVIKRVLSEVCSIHQAPSQSFLSHSQKVVTIVHSATLPAPQSIPIYRTTGSACESEQLAAAIFFSISPFFLSFTPLLVGPTRSALQLGTFPTLQQRPPSDGLPSGRGGRSLSERVPLLRPLRVSTPLLLRVRLPSLLVLHLSESRNANRNRSVTSKGAPHPRHCDGHRESAVSNRCGCQSRRSPREVRCRSALSESPPPPPRVHRARVCACLRGSRHGAAVPAFAARGGAARRRRTAPTRRTSERC